MSRPLSTLAPDFKEQIKTVPTPLSNGSEPLLGQVPASSSSSSTTSCSGGKAQCTKMKYRWLGALLLWFVIFVVLFWLVYYSLKPWFVLQHDTKHVDTGKVLLASVISAFILIIITGVIKYIIEKTRKPKN